MSHQPGIAETADSISKSLQSLSLQPDIADIANPVGRPHTFGPVQRVDVDGQQHAYNTLRRKKHTQQDMTNFMNKEVVRFFAKFGWENPERDVPPGGAEPDQATISAYDASAKEARRAVGRGVASEEHKRRDKLVQHVRTIMLARFQTNFPDSKRRATTGKKQGADITKLLLKYWERPSMKQLYKVWASSKPRPDLDAEIDRMLATVREQKGDPEYKRIGLWNTVAADWYRSASEKEKEETMEKAKDVLAEETKKWKEDLAGPKSLEDAVKFMSASKDFLEDLMEFFAEHCGGMAVMILAGAGKVMVSEGVCDISGKPKVKYSEIRDEEVVLHAVSERIHAQACLVTETKWGVRLSDYSDERAQNERDTREGAGATHSPEAPTVSPIMSDDTATAVAQASTRREANRADVDQSSKETIVSRQPALDISPLPELPVGGVVPLETNAGQKESDLDDDQANAAEVEQLEDTYQHEAPAMDVWGDGELNHRGSRAEELLPQKKPRPKPRPTARKQKSTKGTIPDASCFDDAGAAINSDHSIRTKCAGEVARDNLPAPPSLPPHLSSLRSDQLHTTRGNEDVLSRSDRHGDSGLDSGDGVGDIMHIKVFDEDYEPCSQSASATNQRLDLPVVLSHLVNNLVRDQSEETSHFGSKGRSATWSKYVLGIPERYESMGWSVSRAVLQNVLEKYLEFELAKPAPASASCHGWSAFELQGERADVRPVYLSKLQGPHYTAAWPDLGRRSSSAHDAKLADWNIGAALCEQWRLLQPAARMKGGFVSAVPSAKMDWGAALLGGKRGARVLILGLMIWADKLKDIQDGTTKHDWETLAADMALVFDVRKQQLRALAEAAMSTASSAIPPARAGRDTASLKVASGEVREIGGRPKRTVGGRADLRFAERYDALVEQQKRSKK
ncbi:unnamed protein product [Peniophora sp. CBMAI 1063]|nr:unnamed protein product [Peniophora sp. CBMAI 1063]